MRISLLLPASLFASTPGDDRDWSAEQPHLQRLLARADRLPDAKRDANASLCALFDPSLADAPPVAALSALACGLDSAQGYWLHADPVHLQPARDDLTVWPVTDLDAKDAAALAATLNDFLRADNLVLRVGQPAHWLIDLPVPPRLVTWPLPTVAGTPMGLHLPRGADSGTWNARLTELQMLLHDHPCNLRRESEGMTAVNALWLWGGGVLPARSAAPFDAVYSDDTLACGLALHAGCAVQGLPTRLDDLVPSTHVLVTFYEQADATTMDTHWFAPLLDGLRDARVEMLDLLICGASTLHWRIQRRHLWRFWRRPPAFPPL